MRDEAEEPDLPDIVRSFARKDKGFIVISGGDAAAVSSSARTLVSDMAASGTTPLLFNGRLSADTLIEAVDAAWDGALAVVTAPFADHAYSRLIDLLQSAEDGEIRPRFDAMLYAVVQLANPGSAVEPDVHLPGQRE